MDKRVVEISHEDCRCYSKFCEAVFNTFDQAEVPLTRSKIVLTGITLWEIKHCAVAPQCNYLKLCLALFQDADEAGILIYLPRYEKMLNTISAHKGREAARKTLVVWLYAKNVLGVLEFPADTLRQTWR